MQGTTNQTKHPYSVFVVAMCLLFALCVTAGTAGSTYVRTWALQNEARLAGMDWAHHIEFQLRQLDANQKADPESYAPEVLERLLQDVIAVGNIYQIDYVDQDCMCDHSVGNYHPPDRDVHVADHANHTNHLLDQAHSHAPPFPIDHAMITQALADNEHKAIIRKGDGQTQPYVFATVYHPVSTNGHLDYVLRVLVDLERQDATLRAFLILSWLLAFMMLFLLAGYPTLRYFRISRKQKVTDAAANYLAQHDVLTGLHNRKDFQDHLPKILDNCELRQRTAFVYLFDLKNFKEVNDSFGYQAGDDVLITFAALLRDRMPDSAYIARLGGDEFVVVIDGLTLPFLSSFVDIDLPMVCSAKIHDEMRLIDVGISGGVAQFPQDGETAEDILQAAGLALHASKSERGESVRAYTPDLETAYQSSLRLRNDIKKAIQDLDVVPFYQPIVRFETGTVIGFEALARWRQPDGSYLTPGAFESALNTPEIGVALGQCMLRQTVADMARWQKTAVPFGIVGLNVLNADLKQIDYADQILALLKAHGLGPENLAIEVTEHCLFDETCTGPVKQLHQLRDAGCHIALDDFGTGYSSISQLKSLPFTAIKIDKLFVQNVLESGDDQAIIAAMRFLGKSMNFEVILEGIEDLKQLLALQGAGHTLGQGYYFARPMPASDVPDYLARVALASDAKTQGRTG